MVDCTEDFKPSIHYWTVANPPRLEEQLVLTLSRDHLSLFRDVPMVSEMFPQKQVLVLVDGLSEKIAALPQGENLWYCDRSGDALQLQDRLYHLLFSRGREDARAVILTKREVEVFQLVAAGLPSREICQSLAIKRTTLNTHKKHLFLKFKVRSSAQMIAACNSAFYHVGR